MMMMMMMKTLLIGKECGRNERRYERINGNEGGPWG
jgi:hypothetical protein